MAKPDPDKWNIVVLGMWNPHVFSPQWMAKHLFEKEEIEIGVEMALAPGLPARFAVEGVKVLVREDRLAVGVDGELTDDALERMAKVAGDILRKLCHTPVSAVGFNFSWSEDDPPDQFKDLFRSRDIGPIADGGFEILERSFRRVLKEATTGETVSVTCFYPESGEARVDFNFHEDVEGAAAGLAMIEKGVLGRRDTAQRLVQSVYGFELEEAE